MRCILLWLGLATPAWGADCTRHPVLCDILALAPRADPATAYALSNAVAGAPEDLRDGLVVLAYLESSFRLVSVGYPDGHADLGPWQINSRTAVHFGCDVAALRRFDLQESVRCATKVLRRKRAVCAERGVPDAELDACYHSYNPKPRAKYLKRMQSAVARLRPSPGALRYVFSP